MADNRDLEVDEFGETSATTQQRFYEAQYPSVDDLVVVLVRAIAEMGAYVTLLEYGNIEGMILFSELSRRRIRSISSLIRVGREEVVQVLRVDPEKGYIDLSKRRVDPDDIARADDKYTKACVVQGILKSVAFRFKDKGITLSMLCEKIAWPLYRRFGHAHTAFQRSIANPDEVFSKDIVSEVLPEVVESLKTEILRRLKPQPLKLRADIFVSCFQYEGIEAVKRALLKGKDTGGGMVDITLVAAPLYILSCSTENKAEGLEAMNKCLDVIRKEIEQAQGNFSIEKPARVVSEKDDKMLSDVLQSAADEQDDEASSGADESGDDDDEEDAGAEGESDKKSKKHRSKGDSSEDEEKSKPRKK